eukprot:747274-Hanusia_phi.AAC.4
MRRGENDDDSCWGQVGVDHWERFEGNTEDHFRIGIQLHSKFARLFAPFYTADIIVASPLGLRMIVKSADGGLSLVRPVGRPRSPHPQAGRRS